MAPCDWLAKTLYVFRRRSPRRRPPDPAGMRRRLDRTLVQQRARLDELASSLRRERNVAVAALEAQRDELSRGGVQIGARWDRLLGELAWAQAVKVPSGGGKETL